MERQHRNLAFKRYYLHTGLILNESNRDQILQNSITLSKSGESDCRYTGRLWTDEHGCVCVCVLITSRSSCSILYSTSVASDKLMSDIRNAHIQERLKDNRTTCLHLPRAPPDSSTLLSYTASNFYLEGHPDGVYLGS